MPDDAARESAQYTSRSTRTDCRATRTAGAALSLSDVAARGRTHTSTRRTRCTRANARAISISRCALVDRRRSVRHVLTYAISQSAVLQSTARRYDAARFLSKLAGAW